MDDARIPLESFSFSAETALGSYFQVKELAATIHFGQDMSFTSKPNTKEAQCNNQSAMQFPEYVSHYVAKELVHGSFVGPFKPGDLPFRFFRSPFGLVPKSNSKWRRMVTDCQQISPRINSYIDPTSHRSAPSKLILINLFFIVRAILRTKQLYANQQVVMWKCDMAHWYRWMLLDPSNILFFATMWQNQVFLDRNLSFSNRGSALAVQQLFWGCLDSSD